MRTQTMTVWTLIGFVGLTTAAFVPAGADDAQPPGIVRIQDAAPLHGAVHSTSLPMNTRPVPCGNASAYGGGATGYCGNVGCPTCGTAACGYAAGKAPEEEDDGHHFCSLCNCLGLHCLGCNSCDHGWGRPVKRPIHRVPVLYQRYWPTAWYGDEAADFGDMHNAYHPMVYMPTDTTQLGFYYQRVPFWRPNPAMTPPIPWPGHWHQRECAVYPKGRIIDQAGYRPAHTAFCPNCQYGEMETVPETTPPSESEQQEEAPPPPEIIRQRTARKKKFWH